VLSDDVGEIPVATISQEGWSLPNHGTAAAAFQWFMGIWEATRGFPPVRTDIDRRELLMTVLAADEPLFVPLNDTDLKKLTGGDRLPIPSLLEAPVFIWDELARSLESEPQAWEGLPISLSNTAQANKPTVRLGPLLNRLMRVLQATFDSTGYTSALLDRNPEYTRVPAGPTVTTLTIGSAEE
jgi:hypothetical protein